MRIESQIIPLKDEERSRKIDIPTQNLKKTYSMDPKEFAKPQHRRLQDDGKLDDDVPPNFVYHIEDSKPGDLLKGIRDIEQGRSIAMPNAALGLNDTASIKENRNGLTSKYGALPELPEYEGLQNGDDTISRLMKGFLQKNNLGDGEFKQINRKNDLMLQKLIDDKPEDRYRLKPHVYVDPQERHSEDFMDSLNGTFNDRSTVGFKLPSDSKRQNFDVVNKWESTLNELKSGIGIKDGIREKEYPLKPFPFDSLH